MESSSKKKRFHRDFYANQEKEKIWTVQETAVRIKNILINKTQKFILTFLLFRKLIFVPFLIAPCIKLYNILLDIGQFNAYHLAIIY